MNERDVITQILASHKTLEGSASHCICGYYAQWTPTSHETHQARAVIAALKGAKDV